MKGTGGPTGQLLPEHHNTGSETSSTTTTTPSRTLVFLTVSFYLVAALVMVFVNKWVLNSVSVPVFLLFCQLVIAVVLLKLSHFAGLIKLPQHLFRSLFNSASHFKVLKSVLPMVLINVSGLIFNTYCLKFVDASFYQVARGLILPFTVFASHMFLGTRASMRIYISVGIVCLGFMLGVSSERMTVSQAGVILGILSSVTTAVHAIVVKQTLEKVPSTIALTYYSNGLSALIVLPLVLLVGEAPTIFALFSDGYERFRTFFLGTLVTGLFGFFICIAGLLSIKVTSPVTHMISSAVRGVIQTILGATLFGDKITSGRVTGIGLILAGSIYYTWVKEQEVGQKAKGGPTEPGRESRIRLGPLGARDHDRQQETHSLVLKVSDHNNDDEDEDDRQIDGLDRSYHDQISPRSVAPSASPKKDDDDGDDDDDDDDEDDDSRELRKAEKALGI
ncbi:hypothetical protein PGT21_007379 [Puccinia graminis f. sp. tritici]|uniref:Sugar phosphate transporter domain-containing protein n=1 Tax=Puccinia graminis f. sp. tritici TaxID=56615 RepID=A0A5B0RE79_PUCGR|nr:hypothetical protein PGT21_007379 [Puccinia graminis f. sp. tritici]KAA1123235.1 hypothetical protein PGTUg99_013317 [Puccinia graminis f. sp. tritici]